MEITIDEPAKEHNNKAVMRCDKQDTTHEALFVNHPAMDGHTR